MFGLQKLMYGPLRPIEVEQLYEKAWFAITETCLAMTIFREEVGGWFVVMFVSLLIGKIWGWIGEGRVEILEQQPPANPRLFHARLSTSLVLSICFEMYMLNYSVQTVRQQARPNMMVIFAFEFAVLTVTSMSTFARYTISLYEASVVKKQTSLRLQERRAQLQHEQEEVAAAAVRNGEPLPVDTVPIDDDLELDTDVPGWEEKGRWVFYLDLATGMCLWKASLSLLMHKARFLQTCSIPHVLLCIMHVLWHAYPHHSRCSFDYPIFLQKDYGLRSISTCDSRYERKVSRCDCRRDWW